MNHVNYDIAMSYNIIHRKVSGLNEGKNQEIEINVFQILTEAIKYVQLLKLYIFYIFLNKILNMFFHDSVYLILHTMKYQ